MEQLEKTIKKAQDKGVKLVFTISPVVNKIKGKNSTIKTLRSICSKYDIPFIDDSQLDGFVSNPNQGYDSGHLNSEAAALFTRTLISQIKQEKII